MVHLLKENNKDASVKGLARMLGGVEIKKKTIANAAELLAEATRKQA